MNALSTESVSPEVTLRHASVWRRFVCMGYEGFLLVGPVLVLGFLYSFLVGYSTQTPGDEDAKGLGLQLVVLAALLYYFAWGWSRGRVTLPMQTLQLEVVDAATGGPIGRGRALARAALGMGSLLTLAWLWFAFLRTDRQAPHDVLTKTALIHRPRPRPM